MFYYKAPESYDEAGMAKFEKAHLQAVYGAAAEKLAAAKATTAPEFDAIIKDLCTEKDWKMPQVGQPIRLALSGVMQAPGIGEIVVTLGKEETVRRILKALEAVRV
jgi:glutamyl-tRNA synthetase